MSVQEEKAKEGIISSKNNFKSLEFRMMRKKKSLNRPLRYFDVVISRGFQLNKQTKLNNNCKETVPLNIHTHTRL